MANWGTNDSRAVRSHWEVAELMTARGYPMTRQNVVITEHRALRKLRAHVDIERLAMECGVIQEGERS